MSGRGDFQKRISKILAEANAQNLTIEEIMPEELQDHFEQLTELQVARGYIHEVEGREKDLKIENSDLLNKLKAKESEIENMPEDYMTAKLDLQQAQNSIKYYKKLAANDADRADRCQRKLTEALDKQSAADAAAEKLVCLQVEIEEKRAMILKLQNDNRLAAETHERILAHSKRLLEDKEAELTAARSHATEVEVESEQFSENFTILVETLESEHAETAVNFNDKSALLRKRNDLHSAIAVEIMPLKSCFERASEILGIYQFVFKTLTDPCSTTIGGLPRSLDSLMLDAASDLRAYRNLHQSLEAEGAVNDHVRLQLQDIATTAGLMFNSFDCIKHDVDGFLGRLRREPKLWSAMKAKFGTAGRMKRFSLV